ncbi:MAG TPA: glycosyltransferase [bacterium]|nr:glycosyltransferase [bacterium]
MFILTINFLLLICYLVFIYIIWHGLTKIKACGNQQLLTVSIIVAMRNEASLAARCLDALLNLDYPRDLYEIIVVDDGSTDRTPLILSDFQSRYPFIRFIRLNQYQSLKGDKKRALTIGISKSSNEILLFTDADCVPPPGWIKQIISCFDNEVGLVAGFSPVRLKKNTQFAQMVELDSFAAAIVAAAAIGNDSAVTCTGRNLAYRRQLFYRLNGFDQLRRSISGDDDLLLQLAHRQMDWKIRYVSHRDGIVPSYPELSRLQLFRQKQRHLSAGKYYSPKIQLYYAAFHLSNAGLFLFPLVAMLTENPLWLSLIFLIVKILSDRLLLNSAGRKFSQTFITSSFLGWELFFLFYHIITAPAAFIGKIKWK